MAKKKKNQFETVTEEQVRKELDYLVMEGFAVYDKKNDTWRLKTQEEIDEEIENV